MSRWQIQKTVFLMKEWINGHLFIKVINGQLDPIYMQRMVLLKNTNLFFLNVWRFKWYICYKNASEKHIAENPNPCVYQNHTTTVDKFLDVRSFFLFFAFYGNRAYFISFGPITDLDIDMRSWYVMILSAIFDWESTNKKSNMY